MQLTFALVARTFHSVKRFTPIRKAAHSGRRSKASNARMYQEDAYFSSFSSCSRISSSCSVKRLFSTSTASD